MIYRCNLKGMEAEILLTRLQPFPIDCNLSNRLQPLQSTATFAISKCRVSAGTDKLCMAHYLGGSKVLMPQVKAQLADRDRERLAWLCGMFGSKFEGERANAATLAYQLVRRAGLTWPDVIGTPMLTQSTESAPVNDADPFAAWPGGWRDAITHCLRYGGRSLTDLQSARCAAPVLAWRARRLILHTARFGRRGSARVMRPMQCDRHPFVCSGKRAANIARHGLRLRSLRRTPGAMFAMTRNTDTVHAGCDADQAGVSPRTGQPTVYMQTCAHPRCNVSGASCSHQGQIGISPPPQSADAGASDTSSLIMPATVASREFSPTHLLPTSTTDNGLGGQQRNR